MTDRELLLKLSRYLIGINTLTMGLLINKRGTSDYETVVKQGCDLLVEVTVFVDTIIQEEEFRAEGN